MKKLILLMILILACVVPASVFGSVIHVPDDQPTIQAGIDAAHYLDTVLVADGTWIGADNKNLDFKGKAITVQSENGPANCIIDCEYDGRGFYFHTGEGVNSVLSGFTITNGSASGIHCTAAPTITNCIITYNTSGGEGGGISCSGQNPTISNCIISYNFSSSNGGGICCRENSPTIIDCKISFNTSNGSGGGVFSYGNGHPTITNCTIDNNTAHSGGGIYGGGFYPLDWPSTTITNCTISDNVASESVGGIYQSYGTTTITNCICWGNTPNEISGSATVTYSDVEGGYAGDGNIDVDPLLDGNYHLTADSPCIDAGTSEGAPDHDIDGDPRPLGADFDMGSDEFRAGPHTPVLDIKVNDSNGPVDVRTNQTVSVTVALDSGDYTGASVDLWIAALTQFGTYWYDSSEQWIKSNTPVWYSQQLSDMPETTVLTRQLPVGVYTFFFILDDTPDGTFDITLHDHVNVFCRSAATAVQAPPDLEGIFQ